MGWDELAPIALGFGIIALIFGGVAYGIYDDAHAEKFSLRKDQFACSRSHEEWRLVGKISTLETVCDQWTRK